MRGANAKGTLRFCDTILGNLIQVLIDGGSFDNFFQPCLERFMHLSVEPTPELDVLVGNGQTIVAEGKISKLPVEIQEHLLIHTI